MKRHVKNFSQYIKSQNKKLPQRLNWWQILILIVFGFLVCMVCDHFGAFDYALPLLGTLLGEFGVIYIKREIWRKWWFWLSLVILMPAQIYFLRFCAIHLKDHSGPSRGPIGGIAVINFLALIGAVHVVELIIGYKEEC